MAAWSDGYFTDIPYTRKFYAELAPGFMAFACLRQGVRPPSFGPGATYLELGCGQGYGLNLLASANPGMRFWGVDFHPGQIENARRLAAAAGLENVTFDDLSFAQLLNLPAERLPKGDVVALHGIWSWVSAENRAAVVQILDRVLNPGGLAYVSYNCLPGWANYVPLQRFIAEHVARGGGDPQTEVTAAFRTAQQLLEGDAAYFGSSSNLKARIEEGLRGDPAYLVHEYLNSHSQPFFHADVARDLDGARLSFAASANIADDFVHLAAPAALQPTIQATRDRTWRETLLDYASNKAFRRDIFVRGRNEVSPRERDALLAELQFTLMTAPQAVTFEVPIPIGQLKGKPSLYNALVAALADGPRTYAELAALPQAGGDESAVLQALTLLVGTRRIHPLAPAQGEGAAARAFNKAVLDRTVFDEFPAHIAAPLVGSGVQVEFTELIALKAMADGETDDAQVARRGWESLARTKVRLKRDGVLVTDQAGSEAELMRRLADFRETRLPALQRLGVI